MSNPDITNENRTLEALKLARDIIREGMDQGRYPSVGNYAYITEAIAAAEQSASYHIVRATRMHYEDRAITEIEATVKTLDEVYALMVEKDWCRTETVVIQGSKVDLDQERLYNEKIGHRQREHQARKELADRAEYERLKKKYEEQG